MKQALGGGGGGSLALARREPRHGEGMNAAWPAHLAVFPELSGAHRG